MFLTSSLLIDMQSVRKENKKNNIAISVITEYHSTLDINHSSRHRAHINPSPISTVEPIKWIDTPTLPFSSHSIES